MNACFFYVFYVFYVTLFHASSFFSVCEAPLFDFGDIIYMYASQDNLSRLEIIQNNACRIILRCNRYTHVSDMLAELKLTTLFYRRDFHISIFMYKILSGLIKSVDICSLFEYLEDQRYRVTRAVSHHELVVPHTRTSFGRKGIQYSGTVVWNNPVIGNAPVGNEHQWEITRTSACVWELADFVTGWGNGVVSCHPIPLSADLSSLIYISSKLS